MFQKNIYNQVAVGGVNGLSAWSDVNLSGNCHLHQGLYTQPDLNLRNSRVRAELETILRFWLDKGVDGLRVNSARYLVEDLELRDEPLLPGGTGLCGSDDDVSVTERSLIVTHDAIPVHSPNQNLE